MSDTISAHPLPAPVPNAPYTAALVCCGYETRARFFWENYAPISNNRTAFHFSKHHVLSYTENKRFYDSLSFAYRNPDSAEVALWAEELKALLSNEPPAMDIKILVDISSMTRLLIASISLECAKLSTAIKRIISVDFVYSNAIFGEMPMNEGPIMVNGPALPALGGWPIKPAAPLGIILGIGYEQDLALGVIEELEAADVWAFRPRDHDERYDQAINERNEGLFNEIPPSKLIHYSLLNAFGLYMALDALVKLAKQDSRLIIVPLGPKIFALASSLVCLKHFPSIGLWRVSSGENLEPIDRIPVGTILGLKVIFKPN